MCFLGGWGNDYDQLNKHTYMLSFWHQQKINKLCKSTPALSTNFPFHSLMDFPSLRPFLVRTSHYKSKHRIHNCGRGWQKLTKPQWFKSTFYQDQRLDANESHFFIKQLFHSFIHSTTAMSLIMACWHTVQVLFYKQEKKHTDVW